MDDLPEILFVDDEPFMLTAHERTLTPRLQGFQLRFESDPQAALKSACERPPAVIVSDQNMPGLDGLALVSELKKAAPNTQAIMLTGAADLALTLGAINNVGVFRFYTKPCAAELLVDGIMDAAEAWRHAEGAGGGKHFSLAERIGAAALNQLQLGIVVLDPSARVLYVNIAGADLLSRKHGLRWDHGEICRASNAEETKQLHELIAAAAADDQESLKEGLMVVSSADGLPALYVSVSPLERGTGDLGGYAVMFVSDPTQFSIPSAASIGKILGLSPSEGRLAHQLAKGHTLEQAAEAIGVTISSARTYLKYIFQKTDTNRQSDLVRQIVLIRTKF